MWSARSSTMRKNCSISVWSRGEEAASTVAAEPFIDVSGARSSWLTMPRNSARRRSSSSSDVMSCTVTTTETTSPSSDHIDVALTSVLVSVPSGRRNTTSSALTLSPLVAARSSGSSWGGDRAPLSIRWYDTVRRKSPNVSAVSAGAGDDALRLPVELHHVPRLRVEDQHTHRGCVDERLQLGIDALLFPVDPRVRDRHRRLRGEHLQRLLVLLGEVRPSRVHPQVDVPHVPLALPDLQAQERPYRQREVREPRRRHVLDDIPRPQRLPQPAQVMQEPPPVGRVEIHRPPLFLRHARHHQVLERAILVHRRDRAVAGAGERASAVRDLLQHRVHVQRLVYAKDGPGQSRDPGTQCLVLRLQPFGFVQHPTSDDHPAWGIDGGSVPRAYGRAAPPETALIASTGHPSNQFSTTRPGMRWKCRRLPVTTVRPRESAMAPILRSASPRGVPRLSNSALSSP